MGFAGCRKDGDQPLINIFSVQDDITLGQQVEDEILSNPTEYPILSESSYASAYAYVNRVVTDIMNSGEVIYKDDFDWRGENNS